MDLPKYTEAPVTYNFSKHLATILIPLVRNTLHCTNSSQDKVQNHELDVHSHT